MAQISRYPVHKAVEQRMFDVFKTAIASLKDIQDIEDFLEDILSPVEKIMLAKRLSIAVLLSKGYRYPTIQEILRVTPSTIASVSLSLKYSGRGYTKIVNKILSDENSNKFWEKIEDMVLAIPPSKGSDWTYWRKEYHKKKIAKRKAF